MAGLMILERHGNGNFENVTWSVKAKRVGACFEVHSQQQENPVVLHADADKKGLYKGNVRSEIYTLEVKEDVAVLRWEAVVVNNNGAPKFSEVDVDKEELITLCKELLNGADLCMRELNVIQPFFSIVKNHSKLIGKYNLI